MGAWGYEIFDNDTACDWQDRLLRSKGVCLIEEALQDVVDTSQGKIDTDVAIRMLAACEALAHLRGRPGLQEASLDCLAAWSQSQQGVETDHLVSLAHQALPRIKSEACQLRRLWEVSGQYDQWLATIDDVARRIA
ncbi:DUF4259 domain-containing protein [Bremerella sp. T1]|uniref:DUF4259 domain-containing protein n=1 Tax=Bremerella sp. TYQ1 TaxID=3119568 RepID=UPI001CCA80F5|nr:DUF4259 domain-containing protein [Bremerella volcania]UBM34823.1 DUF4259 domain-containing protein [Bremerella volcania]